MTYVLFAGDMLVMAFMIGVVVFIALRDNDTRIDSAAQIPLSDER